MQITSYTANVTVLFNIPSSVQKIELKYTLKATRIIFTSLRKDQRYLTDKKKVLVLQTMFGRCWGIVDYLKGVSTSLSFTSSPVLPQINNQIYSRLHGGTSNTKINSFLFQLHTL